MILGSLTIGLNAIFSVNDVFQKLREMRVPQYCQSLNDHERNFSFMKDRTCKGIKEPLEAKVEELRQKLQGIELTVGKYNRKRLLRLMLKQP